MSAKTKVGRNDPCPCGSGKKYKKCCEPLDVVRSLEIPPEGLTGTPLDEYLLLLPAVGLFAEGIRRFDPDGKEFARTVRKFEESFHPGEDGGIPDSVFMSWQFFDFRFGRSRKTLGERLLESPESKALVEEGRRALQDLAASYCGFYEVRGKTAEGLVLGELFDDSERRVRRLHEAYEDEIRPGEIVFARLVGPPDRSYFLTSPYFFKAENRPHFRDMLGFQRDTYLSELGLSTMAVEVLRRESYKSMLPTWLRLIKESADKERCAAKPDELPEDLAIVNTDGDKVCFTKTRFKIAEARAVRAGLNAAPDFALDENTGDWIWEKKDERNRGGGREQEGRTVIGAISIKGGFLIAGTNSLERALRLRGRLEDLLGGAIAFRSIRSRDVADIPPPSPEERERIAREEEELNSRPEIRDMQSRMLEDYYFIKWPETKIPALGGHTPREAMATEAGRRGVVRLLDEIETMEMSKKPGRVRFDFDRLRMKLGLPPQKQ